MSTAPGDDPALAAVAQAFAPQLIAWQRQHGRHHLPWQQTRDPYPVWLSEVMLQQTQVSTVLDYFPRFLASFPTVQHLAAAQPDEVMALWAGLGYYSRARNLHRCAQTVVAQHGGRFPGTATALQTLPGIGASTAAAIAAFCFGERVSILDGNVRRVLSRLLAFEGDLAQAPAARQLWQQAQQLLPQQPTHDDMRAYTQGLMDLGATLCTRSRPQCLLCPVQSLCRAQQTASVARYPVKSRTLVRRHESWWLLYVLAPGGQRLWLQRRPAPGIWAGLYCPPVFMAEAELLSALPAHWGHRVQWQPPVSHSLTHRELHLHACRLVLAEGESLPADWPGNWFDATDWPQLGLPVPVRLRLSSTLCTG